MRIKEMTFMKSIKIGMPNYSNMDISFGMTVEAQGDEVINEAECWDHVNQQLGIQTQGVDPSWITTKEYGNFFKTTIKTPKQEGIL